MREQIIMTMAALALTGDLVLALRWVGQAWKRVKEAANETEDTKDKEG